MITESDAQACGCGFIAVLGIIIAIIIGTAVDGHNSWEAFQAFQGATYDIEKPVVNSYGSLTGVWIKQGAAITCYMPRVLIGQELQRYLSLSYIGAPTLYLDKPKDKSQTLTFVKDTPAHAIHYELHLWAGNWPEVNTATHGKWGEF